MSHYSRTANIQYNRIAVTAFVISAAAGLFLEAMTKGPAPLYVGVLVGLYLLHAIKVVSQSEKVALLRVGHYVGLRGPGMFLIVPVLEKLRSWMGPKGQNSQMRPRAPSQR